MREFLKRYSLVIGILLMFLLIWPIDLSNAGVLPFKIPLIAILHNPALTKTPVDFSNVLAHQYLSKNPFNPMTLFAGLAFRKDSNWRNYA